MEAHSGTKMEPYSGNGPQSWRLNMFFAKPCQKMSKVESIQIWAQLKKWYFLYGPKLKIKSVCLIRYRFQTCSYCNYLNSSKYVQRELHSRPGSSGPRKGLDGLRVCSLDVAFTTGTVRNRSKPPTRGRYCRAYGRFCKRGHFWRFHMSRSLVSRGRRGTSWHSDVFRNVSKVVCVAGAILLRRFQKMRSSFRGRRSTLDVSIFILRGRRSTSDVSCCVFSANRIVRAASSGDKVQIPWQAWHFVRGAENWRKPRTKHRLWSYEVKLEEVLHEMLVLMLQHVSSRVSGFPVASQCLWRKLQNLSCFKVSKPVVTWLWVACVAVRDILMCLQTCRESFCVARAIVLLRALHSTL